MWFSDRDCSDIVEGVWCSRDEMVDLAVKVTHKIRKCGKELTQWSRTHFGNVRQELTSERKELVEAEKVAMQTGCNGRVRCLKQEIATLVDKENRVWFQRSKVL